MKCVIMPYFFIFFIFLSCKQISTTINERNQIIIMLMQEQEKDPLNLMRKCMSKEKYKIYNDYNDTLYLSNEIDKTIPEFQQKEVIKQYKIEFAQNKKIDFDTSNFIIVKKPTDFDNNSSCCISFSRPIRYKNYYLINLEYNDWASGKRIFYILKENSIGRLEIVLQKLISIN